MIVLFDVGNTHTHVGLADSVRVVRRTDISTADWRKGRAEQRVLRFIGDAPVDAAAVCSVVPGATPCVCRITRRLWNIECFRLTHRTVSGIGLDYPRPETIGPDRLANAVAARERFGAPVIAVDFGTAVTFDAVDRRGNYVGGAIAPGLSAMTGYLHEKTALLPQVSIRGTPPFIGKNTRQAILAAAVHGYRGLVRELIAGLRRELKCRRLPVVATGGYAERMAAQVPEITAVEPLLTLEGLRLTLEARARRPV